MKKYLPAFINFIKSGVTKKVFALILFITVVSNSSVLGQTVSSYTFLQTTGTYSAIAGTQLIASGVDDNGSSMTDIGFTFTYGGTAFTQFSASSNGNIQLGGTGISSGYGFAYYANLIAFAAGDGKTGAAVTYLLSGTAPNRVLTIQYPTWYIYYYYTSDYVNAQIKLYETSNVVEIIYGSSGRSSTYTRQVGLTGASTSDYSVRTTTGSWASTTAGTTSSYMGWSTSFYPASGLIYRWSPPSTPAYKATFTSMNLGSSTWCAGETRSISVNVTNSGTATWTDAGPDVNIGVKWSGTWGDYYYRQHAGNLAPGQSQTYTFPLMQASNASALGATPNPPTYGTDLAAGTYSISFDVVKEGDCWFGNNDNSCGPGNSVYTSVAQTITSVPAVAATPSPDNAATGVCYAGGGAISSVSWAAVSTATSYDVYFGAGSLPGTVTSNVATNGYTCGTLAASTTYYWKVVAKNACGSAVGSSTWTFTTAASPCALVYCASGATSTADEEIYSVTVNGASNALGCGVTAPGAGSVAYRYSNFTTNSVLTSVAQGQTVSFSIQEDECDGSTYYTNGAAIWIDFNQNGVFTDPGEQVYTESALTSSPRTINGSFAIPVGATTGNTRMRISVAEGIYGASLTPCLSYSWGETEDYTINITNACTPPGDPYTYTSGYLRSYVYQSTSYGDFTTYKGYLDQTAPTINEGWTQLVNNSWGSGSVSGGTICGTYDNLFAIKNRGYISLPPGVYNFRGSSDDGNRLFAGWSNPPTTNCMDDWALHGARDVFAGTSFVNNNSSNSDLYMDFQFYENDGDASQNLYIRRDVDLNIPTTTTQTKAGSIMAYGAGVSNTNDVNWYQVDLVSGTSYHFWSSAQSGGTAGLNVRIVKKSDPITDVANQTTSGDYDITYTATSSETYFICVWPANNTSAITYTFNYAIPCFTPGTPIISSTTQISGTEATCNWSAGTPAGSPTITYYWEVKNTGGTTIQSGNTVSTSAAVTGLTCGTTYYFTVYAQTSCNSTSSSIATSGNFSTSACEMMVPSSENNTYTVCSGNLYDYGGSSGNYVANWDGSTVLYPSTAGNMIQISGTTSGETCCDYIYVYDGINTSAPLLGQYVASFGTLPILTATNIDGALTVRFDSDGSINGAGFNISISCYNPPCPALGSVSNAGPIDFCDAGGDFGGVTVSGQTGTVKWDLGSNDGVWNNNWVVSNNSGTCCFPKKTSNNDANADRIRYRVSTGACTELTSSTILIINRYNEAPTSLASSISSYCVNANPGTITLTANFPASINKNGTVRFYSGSCGGTLVGSVTAGDNSSTASVSISAPSATTTYFVLYDPGSGTGCAATTCAQTTVTVNPLPTINSITATPASICSGSSSQLEVVVPGGGSGGIMPSGYCGSNSSSQDETIVNVSLNGAAQGSGWASYTDYTGSLFTILTAGSSYTISVSWTSAGTFNEYLRAFIDWDRDGVFETSYLIGSGSSASTTWSTNITVPYGASMGETRMRISLKYSGDVSSCETFSFGEVEDYKIQVNSTISYSWTPSANLSDPNIANPVAQNITSATNFYCNVTFNGCQTTSNTTVTLLESPSITSATAAANPICANATTTLTANGVGGAGATVTWYSGAGGTGTNLGTGTTLVAGPGTYYASVTGTCTPAVEASVTVGSTAIPAITSATAAASPICANATTTLTANGVGGDGAIVTWYSGAGGSGTNYGTGTTKVVGPGTYYARVTGTCTPAVEASVTVGSTAIPAITSATAVTSPICANATTTLTANGVGGDGATVTWYSGAGGSGTNYGTGTTKVVGPGTYYARVTGTCTPAVEASVTVGSTAIPAITSATAATSPICANATTTLTANGVGGDGATVTWYSGAGGSGTNYGTGTTKVVGPGTYYARVTGTCTPAVEASVTVTATPDMTAGAASSAPTLCINTAINPDITHSTTLATGISNDGVSGANGLPAGVSAHYTTDLITISGTPTASGSFNYSIPLTGGCGSVSATGTITVTSNMTAGSASSTPTLCINTAINPDITHSTTLATGISNDGVSGANGLPAGVSAHYTTDLITISGIPTASGSFNYSIPLTGGCGSVSATGTITVTSNMTAGSASSTPTLCINTAINPDITHSTTLATGISNDGVSGANGLPAGVSAHYTTDLITISGTPTASGTFNYSIPLTGGCGSVSATGTITVTSNMTAGSASSTPTLCINTALTNITHSTTGATGIGSASDLPAGVTAAWASNTITISGTPTNSGTFNYIVPLTGGCGTVNATGTINVTPDMTVGAASSAPTLCINTALTNITHTTGNGVSGIGTPTGLPAGVTAAWASNTITISGTPTASGTFNYSILLTGGCGTVNATGTITVNPCNPTITLGSSPEVCSGVTTANLPYTATTASPDQYSIDYDATAEGEGFVDVPLTSLPVTPIALVVPSGATAGIYNATITVKNSSTGFSSTTPVGFTVTIKALPTVSISGLSAICVGSTTNVLPSTDGTWISNSSSTATVTDAGVVSGLNPGNATFTFTESASGCTNTTSVVAVEAYPQPVYVSGSGSFCGSKIIEATGGSGGTIYFQGTTSLGTSISSGGTPQTITTIGTNNYYFRSRSSTAQCWGDEGYAIVTINEIPAAVTVSGGGTYCGSAALIAGGGSPGTIYFQGTTSGGTSTAAPSTSQSVGTSGTYFFRSQSAAGCWGPEGSTTVTINPVPATVSVSGGGIYCGSTTITTSGGTGGTIYFQGTTSGGTSTTTASTSESVSASGTYYFRSYSTDGCWGPEGSVAVTINTVPAAPTGSSPQLLCDGAVVSNLQATGTAIKWYSVSTGGTQLNNGQLLIDGNHYYASQTVNSCPSATRLDVVVNIVVPDPPTGSPIQTFCSGDNPKVSNLIANGTAIQWFEYEIGGPALLPTDPLTSQHYYASQWLYGCESQARLVVSVTVNPSPTLSSVTTGTSQLCLGSMATISLTGLLANTPQDISYTVGGTSGSQTASIISDASGEASFNTIALTIANSGQAVTITSLTRTDVTPNCIKTPLSNNTANLPVINALQTIGGIISYYNTGLTLLKGTEYTVELFRSGDNVSMGTTHPDNLGQYTFPDMCPGNYYLVANSSHTTAGSVSGTDAAQVNYWGTHVIPIEYGRFYAGDVFENNNFLSSLDAQRIQDNFVNGTAFDRTNNWIFWKEGTAQTTSNIDQLSLVNPEVTLNAGSPSIANLYALCTGDFNRSFNPNIAKAASTTLHLINNGSVQYGANQLINLPLIMLNPGSVGAVSLVMNFPTDLVEVQDVSINTTEGNLDWAVHGNELRIGWNSLMPINLSVNDVLLTLKLKTTSAFTDGAKIEFTLAATPQNELADDEYNIIPNALLGVNVINTSTAGIQEQNSEGNLTISNHPNPFNGNTTISYNLPAGGHVTLEILNLLGEKVMMPVNEKQLRGNHSLILDGSKLSNGIYFARISVSSDNNTLVRTIKMVSNK